jgi:hypothetical protein
MTSEDTDLLVITCTHDQNDACLKDQTVSLQLCGDQRSSSQGLGKYFKRCWYDTARSTRSYISKIDTLVLTWNDIIEMNQSGLTQRSLKHLVMIKETNHTGMRNKSTDLRIKGKLYTKTRYEQPHHIDKWSNKIPGQLQACLWSGSHVTDENKITNIDNHTCCSLDQKIVLLRLDNCISKTHKSTYDPDLDTIQSSEKPGWLI